MQTLQLSNGKSGIFDKISTHREGILRDFLSLDVSKSQSLDEYYCGLVQDARKEVTNIILKSSLFASMTPLYWKTTAS